MALRLLSVSDRGWAALTQGDAQAREPGAAAAISVEARIETTAPQRVETFQQQVQPALLTA